MTGYKPHPETLGDNPTRQQIFDFVVNHLFNQGVKAGGPNEGCYYRTSDGALSCAVGCLIPDKLYDEAMECGTVHTLLLRFCNILPDYFWSNRFFLKELQILHDTCPDTKFTTTYLNENFKDIAFRYGLKYETREQSSDSYYT